MSAFEALVLGIVQGVTEFLPISSTAHLRIVPHWLGWSDPGTEFSAVIQLGTLLSVLLYFREDVVRLTCAALRSLADRKLFATQDSRLAWSIVVGTLPVVILGLGFKDWIKTEARQLWIIGVALIGLAILLWLAERYSRRRGNLDTLGFWSVQGIGLCQALALIPGCSRSGSTIMGGCSLDSTAPRRPASPSCSDSRRFLAAASSNCGNSRTPDSEGTAPSPCCLASPVPS